MTGSLALLCALTLAACGGRGDARPIHAQARVVTEAAAPGCQIVFFPGLGDQPRAFDPFVDALEAADIRVRTVQLPNRDYGATDFSDQLMHDVVGPARDQGIRRTWLVAVSMGSAPALRFAETHPDAVTGVVLIAPAFGTPFLAKRVRAAGGPEAFEPRPADRDGRAFHWLANPVRSDGSRVSVKLAFGRQDALAPVAETMATVLPDEDVLVGAGGHEWPVWEELWGALVESGFLQQSCGAVR